MNPTEQTDNNKIVPLQPKLCRIPYSFEIPKICKLHGTIILFVSPRTEKAIQDFVDSVAMQSMFIFFGSMIGMMSVVLLLKSIQIIKALCNVL